MSEPDLQKWHQNVESLFDRKTGHCELSLPELSNSKKTKKKNCKLGRRNENALIFKNLLVGTLKLSNPPLSSDRFSFYPLSSGGPTDVGQSNKNAIHHYILNSTRRACQKKQLPARGKKRQRFFKNLVGQTLKVTNLPQPIPSGTYRSFAQWSGVRRSERIDPPPKQVRTIVPAPLFSNYVRSATQTPSN